MRVEAGDEVLTLRQAAGRLGMSADTLRLQVRNGKLDATLAGKTYLVTASEMERYRRAHRGRYGFASPDHPGQTPDVSRDFAFFYVMYPPARRGPRAKATAWEWWRANVDNAEAAARIAESAEVARYLFRTARLRDRHFVPTMGEWLVGDWWRLGEPEAKRRWAMVRDMTGSAKRL